MTTSGRLPAAAGGTTAGQASAGTPFRRGRELASASISAARDGAERVNAARSPQRCRVGVRSWPPPAPPASRGGRPSSVAFRRRPGRPLVACEDALKGTSAWNGSPRGIRVAESPARLQRRRDGHRPPPPGRRRARTPVDDDVVTENS